MEREKFRVKYRHLHTGRALLPPYNGKYVKFSGGTGQSQNMLLEWWNDKGHTLILPTREEQILSDEISDIENLKFDINLEGYYPPYKSEFESIAQFKGGTGKELEAEVIRLEKLRDIHVLNSDKWCDMGVFN